MGNSFQERNNRIMYDRVMNMPRQSPILLLIISIIVICIGLHMQNSGGNSIPNAKKTQGTIYWEENFTKSTVSKRIYDVYVDYTINGKRYYKFLYSGTPKEINLGIINYKGTTNQKEVTVYYSSDNPDNISIPTESIASQIIILFGQSLFVVFIVTLFVSIIQKKDKGKSYENSQAYHINSTAKKISKTFGNIKKAITTVIGILVLIFGVLGAIAYNKFDNNAVQTTGTIYKIDKNESRDAYNKRIILSDVYIKYKVNGKEFDEVLERLDTNINVGDSITIYYDPDSPNIIKKSKDNVNLWYGVILVGFLFACAGIFLPAENVGISYRD